VVGSPSQDQGAFGDYIVYIDESGDHGLVFNDPQYPVFVLAFCIFAKSQYRLEVVPALQNLKFQYFGHDMVVLHERDIRKASGDFSFLVDRGVRNKFMDDMSRLIDNMSFTLIASVILKRKLCEKYVKPHNPYHLALGFGLERTFSFLKRVGQGGKVTHLVVESRGKREDEDLAAEFKRVCGGDNFRREKLPFSMRFADKRCNCSGLQLADLIARPIGRKMLNVAEENRAYEIIEKKFFRNGEALNGWGLKVFP